MTHICIIGSGLAGYLVATEIRKQLPEASITMLTTTNGAYYSKPMLSTALAQGKTSSDLVMFSAAAMELRLKIKIITHVCVEKIDPEAKTIITGKDLIDYDSCILAIGSDVIPLKLEQEIAAKIFTVNSLDDYSLFRDSLTDGMKIAVIGSGLVGVEFAHDLSAAGYSISVVGDAAYPLNRLIPAELGQVLQQTMQDKLKVSWHLNESVVAVEQGQDGVRIECSSGAKINADIVLSAIGIKANLNLAKASGIKTGQGVLVDEMCRTNFSSIYALGDCAEVAGLNLHYVPPIRKCAAAIAATLAGSPTPVNYPAMPVSVKSPVCPIAVCIPRTNDKLTCDVTGMVPDLVARFVDCDGALRGFALSGAATKQKSELSQQIENWLG